MKKQVMWKIFLALSILHGMVDNAFAQDDSIPKQKRKFPLITASGSVWPMSEKPNLRWLPEDFENDLDYVDVGTDLAIRMVVAITHAI